jgi:low affinity Fe/Cu permease
MGKSASSKKVATASQACGAIGREHALNRIFSEVAHITSREAGRPWVFVLACAIILVWGVTGPLFHFSDTWQLVINTGTTIVTFLMVFLIQNSQNRDAAAIQVKLDELIRVSKAQNSFVGVEHLTDEELEELRTRCESRARAQAARRGGGATTNDKVRSVSLNGATGARATGRRRSAGGGGDDQLA